VTKEEEVRVEDGIKARVKGKVESISGSTRDIVEKCKRKGKKIHQIKHDD